MLCNNNGSESRVYLGERQMPERPSERWMPTGMFRTGPIRLPGYISIVLNTLKSTKYSDKSKIYDYPRNSSSRERVHDSMAPDRNYKQRRNSDDVHKSRNPDYIDKSRRPNIDRSRSPDSFDQSRRQDEINTPRNPEKVYKSKLPDNIRKSRSPNYMNDSQDLDDIPKPRSPHNTYKPRSPDKVYKSHSPDRMRKTRSRDHNYDSHDSDFNHKPRSRNKNTPRSPDNAYNSKRSHSIRKARYPDHSDESEDPEYIHKRHPIPPAIPDNKMSKSPDAIRKSRSRDYINDSDDLDYIPRRKSPNNIYKPRSPDNAYKSKRSDSIRKARYPDKSDESGDPENILKQRHKNNIKKSKSPDSIRKSKIRDHFNDSEDPDYIPKLRSPNDIYKRKSPDDVYKSKSPGKIRKPRSRHHIYQSQVLDYAPKERSPDDVYARKSPAVYKSKSPDNINEIRSPDIICKSRSPEHMDKPYSPDNIRKSRYPDHIDKSRGPDNIKKSGSPEHISGSQVWDYFDKPRCPDPRSPDNVYKSRSPDYVHKPPSPVNIHKGKVPDNSRPSSQESVCKSKSPENFLRRRGEKSNPMPKKDIHKNHPTDGNNRARSPHNIPEHESSQHVMKSRSPEKIDKRFQDKRSKRSHKSDEVAKQNSVQKIEKSVRPLYTPKTISSHGLSSDNIHPSSRSVTSNHSVKADSSHHPPKKRSLHHSPRNTNPQQMHRNRDDYSKSGPISKNQKDIYENDLQGSDYECGKNSSKTYVIVVSKSVSKHKTPKDSYPHKSSKSGSPTHSPKSSPTNVSPKQIKKPISQENLCMENSQDYIEKYIEKLHRSTSNLDENIRQQMPNDKTQRMSIKSSPNRPRTRERKYGSSSEESGHKRNILEKGHRHSKRKSDRRRSGQEKDHKHRDREADHKPEIIDAAAKHRSQEIVNRLSSQETIFRSEALDKDDIHNRIHMSRSWGRDSERGIREKDKIHSSQEKVESPANYGKDNIDNEQIRLDNWERDEIRDKRDRRDDLGKHSPFDNQQRVNISDSYEKDHSHDKRATLKIHDSWEDDYKSDNKERQNKPGGYERDQTHDKRGTLNKQDSWGNDYPPENQDRVNKPGMYERDHRRDKQETLSIRDDWGNDYRHDSPERVNRPDSWDRGYTRDNPERVHRTENWDRDYQRDRRYSMNRPDNWEGDYRQDNRDRVNGRDNWDRNYRPENQERLNRPGTWEEDYRRDNHERMNRPENWDRNNRYYQTGRLDNVAGDYGVIDKDSSKNMLKSSYDNYEDEKKYKEMKSKERQHKFLWKRWERLTMRRSSDMDGLQRVLMKLGELGPYQCMLLCMASPVFFMWAYILYAQIFVLATPSDYFCEVDHLRPKFACDVANFDLKAIPHITFFTGAFVGSLIFGVIADIQGRLYALVASNVVVVVSSVISALLTDLKAFAIARFFTGLGYDTCLIAIYILVVECVGPSKRAMAVNLLVALFFGIGGLLLPSIASLIANWQRFLVATSLPMLMVTAIRFMVPESLRWLLHRGRWTDAIKVIRKMQIARKRQVHTADLDRLMVETVNSPVKFGIRDAMSSPYIRLMVLIFALLFFIVMMLFKFLVLILEFIDVKFFNAFRYSAALEIPAGIVGGFLINSCGRRLLTWVPMIATAIYVIAAHYFPDGIVFATLVIMARLYVAVSRNTLFLWMTEVMPTGARAAGSGLAHASGHLGCIVAPIFAHLVGLHKKLWPLLFMGVLLIFSTIFVCMLPDTSYKPLPQKISVAKKRFQQSLQNFKSKFTLEGLVDSVHDRRRGEYEKTSAQRMAAPAAYGDISSPDDPLRPMMPRQWRTSDGII